VAAAFLAAALIADFLAAAAAEAAAAELAAAEAAEAGAIRSAIAGLNPTGCMTNCWSIASAADAALGGAAVEAPLPAFAADGALVEAAAGGPLQGASLADIGAQVGSQAGSRAIVAVDWANGGGHIFNAVERAGQVFWVDAQSGAVSTSVYETLGASSGDIVGSWFILFP
jgi:hypothetical protein